MMAFRYSESRLHEKPSDKEITDEFCAQAGKYGYFPPKDDPSILFYLCLYRLLETRLDRFSEVVKTENSSAVCEFMQNEERSLQSQKDD